MAASIALLVAGGYGAVRYGLAYARYRGFPAPAAPASVVTADTHRRARVVAGVVRRFSLTSAAVGGRRQAFYVFLPPGYDMNPTERYPVFYLLHGLLSAPTTYLSVGRGAVQEEVLVAEHRMKPVILVLPAGPWRTDTEWADGKPGSHWETFIARDLVGWIDHRFRTIPTAAGRAIGGLSEGGYAALNIGFHHPEVFGTIESWSGYSIADQRSGVFGNDPRLIAYNSPLDEAPSVAGELRARHTFVWFYIARTDPLRPQDDALAAELARLGIDHVYFTAEGSHTWRLWRRYTADALIAASQHLAHETP